MRETAHFPKDKHTTRQIFLSLYGSTEVKGDGEGGGAWEAWGKKGMEWNNTYFTALHILRAAESTMS